MQGPRRDAARERRAIRDAVMRKAASLFATLALIVGAHTPVRAQRVDSAMVGSWVGRSQITVSWVRQRELAVRVAIRDDGSVSGTIGDAQLVAGRFAILTEVDVATTTGNSSCSRSPRGGATTRISIADHQRQDGEQEAELRMRASRIE